MQSKSPSTPASGIPAVRLKTANLTGNAVYATSQTTEASRQKLVRLPDGTIREPGTFSFAHTLTTARGRILKRVHFEVAPMPYYAGQREGMRLAGELLTFIKLHGRHCSLATRVIAEAFGGEPPKPTLSKHCAENVANGFIDTLLAMLEGAACQLDHAGHIERAIARSLEEEAHMAAYDRDRNQKIGKKAAATRKAKREAKAVS